MVCIINTPAQCRYFGDVIAEASFTLKTAVKTIDILNTASHVHLVKSAQLNRAADEILAYADIEKFIPGKITQLEEGSLINPGDKPLPQHLKAKLVMAAKQFLTDLQSRLEQTIREEL